MTIGDLDLSGMWAGRAITTGNLSYHYSQFCIQTADDMIRIALHLVLCYISASSLRAASAKVAQPITSCNAVFMC